MYSEVPNAAAFGDIQHSSSEIILPDNDIFTMSVYLVRYCSLCFVLLAYVAAASTLLRDISLSGRVF